MILYIEIPKLSTKNLLDLISEFSKIVEYEINIKKSVASVYTNEYWKRNKIISFTTLSKTIKQK